MRVATVKFRKVGVGSVGSPPPLHPVRTNADTHHQECRRCGSAIVPHPHAGRPRLYCSERCSRAAKYDRERTGSCERCGSPARTRFCSSACSNIATFRERVERTRRNRERWRERAHLLRARAAGVWISGEPISIDSVAARDGWTCGICREPIDPALRYPHPFSATVDHIEEMGQGGDHSGRNVRLAHRRCNLVEAGRRRKEREILRQVMAEIYGPGVEPARP